MYIYLNGPRKTSSRHTKTLLLLFPTRFLMAFFLALRPPSITDATLCLPEEFADGRFRWNRAITTRTPRDKSESSAYDER